MQNANEAKSEPMLPVGDTPFWEEETSDDESEGGKRLKSVPESYALLRSLKQSRDRWLYHTFPKFSTKARGNKAPEITQPAHTIQARGRCDIQIGPHLFPETIVYEVNYLASQVPAPTAQPASSNPYWHTAAPYQPAYTYPSAASTSQVSAVPGPTTTPASHPAVTSAPAPSSSVSTSALVTAATTAPHVATPIATTACSTATSAPEPEQVPAPLISSLTPVSAITPGLISQVNAAASANPTLANLLQLAAAGDATQDQLKTLGLLIQSLAVIESAKVATLAAANAAQQQHCQPTSQHVDYYQRVPQVPVKPFDIVLEFRETPGERWLFPRGSVHAERPTEVGTSKKNPDIVLTTCLSNDGKVAVQLTDQLVEESVGGNSGLYKAALRLKEAPILVWDTIYRWIGGQEKNEINKKHLDNLVQPKRLFLGLQLPPGPLLTQVQNASGPSYTMKLLRHGPTPQSRAARNRKPYAEKKTAASKAAVVKAVAVEGAPAKKSRATQAKSPATPIQCMSCKQTDVPLILGGRYCRPCVDAGKHNITVPQTTPPDAPSTSTAAPDS